MPSQPIDLRDALVNRLMKIVAVAGGIAYVPSVYLGMKNDLWVVVIADSLAFGLAAVLALLPRLPTSLKIATVLVLSYALGLLLLLLTGPHGAGHLFVFTFVFLAVLFYGNRGMVAANALAIVTHAALVAGSAWGLLSWEQSLDSVVVIAANYILVSILLTGAAQFLLQGYNRAAEDERRLREVTELLLAEIEHRAKNNLQVISSLVTLRSRSGKSPEEALDQIRESLTAMASVQHLLYRQNDEYLVRLPELLQSLMDRYRSLHRPVAFHYHWTGPAAVARSEQGVTLGLLINEIVMNAVRHAFADPNSGQFQLEAAFDQAERLLVLTLGDNGRGSTQAAEGTGSRIIRALAQQLPAEMTVERGPGTRYRFVLTVADDVEGGSE